VAEAAVVAKPHDIKGESVFAYVVLNAKRPEGEEATKLIGELRNWVGEQLSPIAKPDDIRLTDNLPKTRSGKIMRRLLRSVARGEDITQDMSTLENPAILEQLRGEADGAPQSIKVPPASKEKPKNKAAPKAKPRAKVKAKPKVKAGKPKAKSAAKPKRKAKVKAKVKTAAKKSAARKSPARKAKPRAAATRRAKPRRKK
jgi:AMP-binding enzyme C-terminal domain